MPPTHYPFLALLLLLRLGDLEGDRRRLLSVLYYNNNIMYYYHIILLFSADFIYSHFEITSLLLSQTRSCYITFNNNNITVVQYTS